MEQTNLYRDPKTEHDAYTNLISAICRQAVVDIIAGMEKEQKLKAYYDKEEKERRRRNRRKRKLKLKLFLAGCRMARRSAKKQVSKGRYHPKKKKIPTIVLNREWVKAKASAEAFLQSSWFSALCGFDGKPLLYRIKTDSTFRYRLRRRMEDKE